MSPLRSFDSLCSKGGKDSPGFLQLPGGMRGPPAEIISTSAQTHPKVRLVMLKLRVGGGFFHSFGC